MADQAEFAVRGFARSLPMVQLRALVSERAAMDAAHLADTTFVLAAPL